MATLASALARELQGWDKLGSFFDAIGQDPVLTNVKLIVDTYKGDPTSQFRLEGEHFIRIGEKIASLGLPTLFVMEGGYALAEIGINTVNVLQGFDGA